MNPQQLKNIIEAALLTAAGPLSMARLQELFGEESSPPDEGQINAALETLAQEYADRGIELKQVSSGYRIQARQEMGQWLHRLSEEKPGRYSRALLETLALIAYRQPITRAGVEDVRGVSVSSSIIKTLLEREWIRVVGHRDVPGRPALYGTTKQFLDYFNLKSLSELPELAEMRSIDDIQREFELTYTADGADHAINDGDEPELDLEAGTGNEAATEASNGPDASDLTTEPVAAHEADTGNEKADHANDETDSESTTRQRRVLVSSV